jgi:NAD+ diphosphatase
VLGAVDRDEQVLAYREIHVGELQDIANSLDQLSCEFSTELGETWHEWGRFRAVVHREVWSILTRGPRLHDTVATS